MIDHVSVGTNDIARAHAFYDTVLGCIGVRLLQSDEHSADYGVASIVVSVETPLDGRPATRGNGMHVAFAFGQRDLVETLHRTALCSWRARRRPAWPASRI